MHSAKHSSGAARHAAILYCTLALSGAGMAHAGVVAQSPVKKTVTRAATSVPLTETEREAKALAAAQDRAVAHYQRSQRARAVAAKLALAQTTAAAAAAAKAAQAEASALAHAQDRVVAYYKGIRPVVTANAARAIEVLTCFTGVEDRHARIGVQLVNGRISQFAFYSKSKPRTCSIAIERNGAFAQWEDSGSTSRVTFAEEKGVMVIDRQSRGYRFVFRGIDRERYCGMDGKINGSLTVLRGKRQCDVQGIMDGHQG